ncbi:Glutamate-gated chloride channel [Eumeta japonica]|uniref:Glutamate-gated chloride channel n=1 Tax=Eumeta variegata TaxID=151549 RepID=A0A4C1TDU4_EUMVA|nr:Glutamate-gated chloride channel [Eumeta japonica]
MPTRLPLSPVTRARVCVRSRCERVPSSASRTWSARWPSDRKAHADTSASLFCEYRLWGGRTDENTIVHPHCSCSEYLRALPETEAVVRAWRILGAILRYNIKTKTQSRKGHDPHDLVPPQRPRHVATSRRCRRRKKNDLYVYRNTLFSHFKYLTLTEANKVWMPDLFFSNEKEGHFHNIMMPNVYIRIFPNGNVLYSIRISLTISCPMYLKLYPFDKQTCSLRMASYGWTTDDLVFLWKEGDPILVVKNLHLPRFTLEKFFTDYCNSKTNTGEYSCLKVDLLFKREFSYYLIQIYIPCCMLVIVSWVSFWLDQGAVPARVSLGRGWLC